MRGAATVFQMFENSSVGMVLHNLRANCTQQAAEACHDAVMIKVTVQPEQQC